MESLEENDLRSLNVPWNAVKNQPAEHPSAKKEYR